MRTAFIDQLVQEASLHDNLFLITGDLGFNVIEPFADKYPDRFLNAGIAEQNMMGAAAGLAKEGYNVYVYSIANFPTLRCMEQIRYDVCYHKANVKIVAVGAGYAYGSLGASHHATEEMGMMRTLPDMVVSSPGDPFEAQALTTLSANYNGPMYFRLGKAGEKKIHANNISNLQIGDILPVMEGESHLPAILATGSILYYAKQFLSDNHIPATLYSVPFVKPINRNQLKDIALKYSSLILLEEHQKSCGMGSAILEQLNDLYFRDEIPQFPKIRQIAINDCFYHISGSQSFLREYSGLVLKKEMFNL